MRYENYLSDNWNIVSHIGIKVLLLFIRFSVIRLNEFGNMRTWNENYIAEFVVCRIYDIYTTTTCDHILHSIRRKFLNAININSILLNLRMFALCSNVILFIIFICIFCGGCRSVSMSVPACCLYLLSTHIGLVLNIVYKVFYYLYSSLHCFRVTANPTPKKTPNVRFRSRHADIYQRYSISFCTQL